MMKRALILLLLFIFVSERGSALTIEEIRKLPTEEIEKALVDEHPGSYYQYAARLFAGGKKDDAVVWFYVGQLRYRFHLESNPKLDASGDPALFASLSATIGQAINEYAGGDLNAFVGQMRSALEWDAKNKNGFTSKVDNKKVLMGVREGLQDFTRVIETKADEIRKERKAQGLEDRGGDQPEAVPESEGSKNAQPESKERSQ